MSRSTSIISCLKKKRQIMAVIPRTRTTGLDKIKRVFLRKSIKNIKKKTIN
jgi:hypothetical protein